MITVGKNNLRYVIIEISVKQIIYRQKGREILSGQLGVPFVGSHEKSVHYFLNLYLRS